MKGHAPLFIVASLLVLLLTVSICIYSANQVELIKTDVLVCDDVSISADKIYENIIEWNIRLFSQLNPDSDLTYCQLTTECVPKFEGRKGLMTPDELTKNGTKDLFAISEEKGTRPLRFLEYALTKAKNSPDKTFILVFFTDGLNDYQGDNEQLAEICKSLIEQPNIIKIGLFGLDSMDKRKVADWNGWFSGSSKVNVCTLSADSTELGINQFCNDVNKKVVELSKEHLERGGN